MSSDQSGPMTFARAVSPAKHALAGDVTSALTVAHSNYVPAQMDRHIDFIDFTPSGEMAVGASNLSGRYWTGSLWLYRDPRLAPSPENSLTGADLDTGVADGRVIGEKGNQMVVALDSGGLEIVTHTSEVLPDNKIMHYLDRQPSAVEHDDVITCLDTWQGSSHVLAATVSHDCSLRVWSPELTVVSSYCPAHTQPLNSVSCHSHPYLIATSSRDLTVRVWDTRQPKPAVVVYRSSATPPSLVSWHPGQEHSLLVGSQTGEVWLQEIRVPRSPPTLTAVMDREVRRARWAGHDKSLVAITGDTNVVKVLDVTDNNIQEIYVDSRHSDYARGVAWNPVDHALWTAGWDQKVLRHVVNKNNGTMPDPASSRDNENADGIDQEV